MPLWQKALGTLLIKKVEHDYVIILVSQPLDYFSVTANHLYVSLSIYIYAYIYIHMVKVVVLSPLK